MKTVHLSPEQLDKVEEAADILAHSMNFVDSMEEAIEIVCDYFIRSVGPLYESRVSMDEDGPS